MTDITRTLRALGEWEAGEGSPYAWRDDQRWEQVGTPDDDRPDGGMAVIAFGAVAIVAMVIGGLLTLAAQAVWP